MSKTWHTLRAAAIVSAVILLPARGAQAQTCNPGLGPAFAGHQIAYTKLLTAVVAQLPSLKTELDAVTDIPTYNTLLNHARSIVDIINTPNPVFGRVVITLPDGTVVVDTSKTDDLICVPNTCTGNGGGAWNGFPVNPEGGACTCQVGQHNSFGHFSRKSVNENHNSRIAIHDSQEWPCGIGIETKFSTSTGRFESGVALRLASPLLGGHLDNTGTVRVSLQTP